MFLPLLIQAQQRIPFLHDWTSRYTKSSNRKNHASALIMTLVSAVLIRIHSMAHVGRDNSSRHVGAGVVVYEETILTREEEGLSKATASNPQFIQARHRQGYHKVSRLCRTYQECLNLILTIPWVQ